MMEIIGFIAALLFGGYLCFASVVSMYGMLALAGRIEWISVLLLSIGLVVLFFTFKYIPFTLTVTTGI